MLAGKERKFEASRRYYRECMGSVCLVGKYGVSSVKGCTQSRRQHRKSRHCL